MLKFVFISSLRVIGHQVSTVYCVTIKGSIEYQLPIKKQALLRIPNRAHSIGSSINPAENNIKT